MYKYLKGEGRDRFFRVDMDEFFLTERTGREYKPATTGQSPYDKHWYCTPCEQIFGDLDGFAATFLRDDVGLGTGLPLTDNVSTVSGSSNGVMSVISKQGWRWLTFLLSIAYRVHMSGYDDYAEIDLGSDSMSAVRDILLSRQPARALFDDFDIVSFIVQRGDNVEGCCLPPRGNTVDGGFLSYWSIWGVWAFVGAPRTQFEFGRSIPYNKPDRIHFALISSDLHLRLLLDLGSRGLSRLRKGDLS